MSQTVHAKSIVNLQFQLSWHSHQAQHVDCYFGEKVNLWRDFLPHELYESLLGKTVGERVSSVLAHEDTVPPVRPQDIFSFHRSQFDIHFIRGQIIEPRLGRFYPKGMLPGVKGVFKADINPWRCVDVEHTVLSADFNHPLAYYDLELSAMVHALREKGEERGGRCHDWPALVTGSGVGFQARYQQQPTDFFTDDPFTRLDWSADSAFYLRPRLVAHIDAQARALISHFYSQFLHPAMQVLDLMSSWQSHLPADLNLSELIGLGLNQEELLHNPQLTATVVHDLNQDPQLPFTTDHFDAVICTVSVEYLTQPFDVFAEVARVLKPDGYFIVSFSNRWFPPKVINIWPEIHEFERMGLVLEYFLRSERFHHLGTYSARQFPRPDEDKYATQTDRSDPVFIIYGQAK